MVKVVVGNNSYRKEIKIDEMATPRQLLEENNIAYYWCNIKMYTERLGESDITENIDKSLNELGICKDEKCFIIAIFKIGSDPRAV